MPCSCVPALDVVLASELTAVASAWVSPLVRLESTPRKNSPSKFGKPNEVEPMIFPMPVLTLSKLTPYDEESVLAGVFQFIPILLQYIGEEASAHVIGAVNSSHSYSSL